MSYDEYIKPGSFLAADILGILIANHYKPIFGSSVVSVGYEPRWDIRFEKGVTMEVKEDKMATATCNAAIEFWNTRKNAASGLLATGAQLWIHCVPYGKILQCHEIETKRLQKLCFETGKIVSGGDSNGNLIKLIPLQELKKISQKIFELRGLSHE